MAIRCMTFIGLLMLDGGVCVGLLVGVCMSCMDGSSNSYNDYEGVYFPSFGFNCSGKEVIFTLFLCFLVWVCVMYIPWMNVYSSNWMVKSGEGRNDPLCSKVVPCM